VNAPAIDQALDRIRGQIDTLGNAMLLGYGRFKLRLKRRSVQAVALGTAIYLIQVLPRGRSEILYHTTLKAKGKTASQHP